MNVSPMIPTEILTAIVAQAEAADAKPEWPQDSWEQVRRAGALAWAVPVAYGGRGLPGIQLLTANETLAGACLTTCFIISQRDAACRRIMDSGNEDLRRLLLPPLARGETFATVGLSQLTTSRQYGQPALVAEERGQGFVLNGVMPWVTGAARADHVVTGAVLPDGRQVLLALPLATPGVRVDPPLELMALQGSLTAQVACENVFVDRQWLLAGPADQVLSKGRGGTGGLETSCLAIGLAGAAIDLLKREAEQRADLRPTAEHLERSRQALRQELHRLAIEPGTPEAASALRARANALVLRATQVALMASKGTGFVRGHPAQRWARQALFFLVWSCPRPAAEATLGYLVAPVDEACA